MVGNRIICALLLFQCCCAVDLALQANAVRQDAEAQLAQRRAAILIERTDQSLQLQQAAAAAAVARAELASAEHAATEAQQSAAHRAALILERDAALERLERRLVDVVSRLGRMNEAMTTELPIIDRQGLSRTVPLMSIGPRQVALGPDADARGAVSDGRIVGLSPPEPIPGTILLDVTGRLATQTNARQGIAGWLAAGRLFIWPILLVGLVGMIVATTRLLDLLRNRPDRMLAQNTIALVRAARLDEARSNLSGKTGDVVAVLRCGIERLSDPRPVREAALESELIAAESRLTRGLGILVLLASIAPLLGLLGTVTGMIDLFSVIAHQGAGHARGLSGGISEALVTTQAGMLVAVPLLICHAVLARLSERRRLVLEETGVSLLGHEAES